MIGFFYPLPPVFSQISFSPSHCGPSLFSPYSPDSTVTSLVQSWKAFVPHAIMCLTPWTSPSPKGDLLLMAHLGGFHTWTQKLKVPWVSPGRTQTRQVYPEIHRSCPDLQLRIPVIFWACRDGPFFGWVMTHGMILGVAGAGYYLALKQYWLCLSLLFCGHAEELLSHNLTKLDSIKYHGSTFYIGTRK